VWRERAKDVKRKITVLALCAILFALCGSVDAQQTKKIPTVGFLLEGFPSSISDSIRIDAFEKACTKSAILKEKVSSSSTGLQRAKESAFRIWHQSWSDSSRM